MNSILSTCFFITLIVCINVATLQARAPIDRDAAELTPSILKVWSMVPDILRRSAPLVYCGVIDHCCGDKDRVEAISLMKDSAAGVQRTQFDQIMQTCMDAGKGNELCSSVVQSMVPSEMTIQNPSVTKYTNITFQNLNAIATYFDPMASVCNSEEFHALVCLANAKLVQNCIKKLLRKLYANRSQNYQKNVLYAKQAFTATKEQLSKAFAEDSNGF